MEKQRGMRWGIGIVVGVLLCLHAGACPADSLWRETPHGFLFSDVRASRLGDVLTILVTESSSTNRTAETNRKKDSTNNFNLANLFGNTHFLGGSSNDRARLSTIPAITNRRRLGTSHGRTTSRLRFPRAS